MEENKVCRTCGRLDCPGCQKQYDFHSVEIWQDNKLLCHITKPWVRPSKHKYIVRTPGSIGPTPNIPYVSTKISRKPAGYNEEKAIPARIEAEHRVYGNYKEFLAGTVDFLHMYSVPEHTSGPKAIGRLLIPSSKLKLEEELDDISKKVYIYDYEGRTLKLILRAI